MKAVLVIVLLLFAVIAQAGMGNRVFFWRDRSVRESLQGDICRAEVKEIVDERLLELEKERAWQTVTKRDGAVGGIAAGGMLALRLLEAAWKRGKSRRPSKTCQT